MSAGGETIFEQWSEDGKTRLDLFAYDDGRLAIQVLHDGVGAEFELDRGEARNLMAALAKNYETASD